MEAVDDRPHDQIQGEDGDRASSLQALEEPVVAEAPEVPEEPTVSEEEEQKGRQLELRLQQQDQQQDQQQLQELHLLPETLPQPQPKRPSSPKEHVSIDFVTLGMFIIG